MIDTKLSLSRLIIFSNNFISNLREIIANHGGCVLYDTLLHDIEPYGSCG